MSFRAGACRHPLLMCMVSKTGTSADFSKPFISQLKVSGGGPIPGIGSQNSVPSFSSMTFKALKVRLSP